MGKYALGSLIFGFSTIVVYAKYDTKFRQWLKTNIYGSDELLKLILFEDKTAHEQPSSVKPKWVFWLQIYVYIINFDNDMIYIHKPTNEVKFNV